MEIEKRKYKINNFPELNKTSSLGVGGVSEGNQQT